MFCLGLIVNNETVFLAGVTDETDAPAADKKLRMTLPAEHEMTFPDVDNASRDETDFPDDLGAEDNAEDQASILGRNQ